MTDYRIVCELSNVANSMFTTHNHCQKKDNLILTTSNLSSKIFDKNYSANYDFDKNDCANT